MPPPDAEPDPTLFGRAEPRSEDARLLDGQGRYVANLPAPGGAHAVFVRSPVAHAAIASIDVTDARDRAGLAAVWTADDLDLPALPPGQAPAELARPVLARGVVRFAGEPVALVVADDLATALDAAEDVWVDYDPLPPVVDPEHAETDEAPRLFTGHGGGNVALRSRVLAGDGVDEADSRAAAAGEDVDVDVLADAEATVTGRFVNGRVAAVPLEAGAVLAVPDGPDRLSVWLSTQVPFRARGVIAAALGLPETAVRVIMPDVGGGFGAKLVTYPEHVAVAAAARRLGRPVRWVEGRSESLQAMCHGRGQRQRVTLGATRDGRLTGLRAHLLADLGAYPTGGGMVVPNRTVHMICGTYRVPAVDVTLTGVVTTTTPTAAYRGAGRPEATALIERAIDLLAGELGLDPAELRRRNHLQPDEMPAATPSGASYDSGAYTDALDAALQAVDYPAVRRQQAQRRERGDRTLLGIGLSSYVEITGGSGSGEYGRCEVGEDGTVSVQVGTSPGGQGHETALAQLAAGVLRVASDDVRVEHSDTGVVARGAGTMGSRTLQIGGSAVHAATEAVLAKARRLAAHLLEAATHDIELFDDGHLGVAGVPTTALSWAELAAAANDPARRPDDMPPGLSAEHDFDPDGPTYPFGAHVSVVDVDVDTGMVRLLRHVAVDDCGRVLNPQLVDGQVHGGLAQGIGQGRYEEIVYDADGNPLTSSLAAYAVPTAGDLPDFELLRPQTPTPRNPLGVKGVGEAGTIGSTPAVQNAVIDALAHLGVRHIDMPATPERVWRAIRQATVP